MEPPRVSRACSPALGGLTGDVQENKWLLARKLSQPLSRRVFNDGRWFALKTVAAMTSDSPMDSNELIFDLQHVRIRSIAQDHFISNAILLAHHRGKILQLWTGESQHWLVSSILDGCLAAISPSKRVAELWHLGLLRATVHRVRFSELGVRCADRGEVEDIHLKITKQGFDFTKHHR